MLQAAHAACGCFRFPACARYKFPPPPPPGTANQQGTAGAPGRASCPRAHDAQAFPTHTLVSPVPPGVDARCPHLTDKDTGAVKDQARCPGQGHAVRELQSQGPGDCLLCGVSPTHETCKLWPRVLEHPCCNRPRATRSPRDSASARSLRSCRVTACKILF